MSLPNENDGVENIIFSAETNDILLLCSYLFFFFKTFWQTHVLFLGGPLVPLFWISGDVSSGFQSGFCLICYFCGGECNVHSPRFTTGATLADLLAAGVQPVTSPHACAEVGLGSDSNVQPHKQFTLCYIITIINIYVIHKGSI